MAYATLLSLTQSLEQILHPDDQSLILPETEQQIMRSLCEKAGFLLSFLENDSQKYSESNLESRIRDVAYEAEAMIESSFAYPNGSKTKIHCFWEILCVLLNMIPGFHHCESCFEFQHDNVKKIVKELYSIKEEVVKMKERNQVKDLPQTKSLPSASTESNSTDQNGIVGLHDEMIAIKDRLTGSPSRREIISIVGMPGIGKTTLAKTLYDDPLIMRRFNVHSWITLSADYNVQQMLTGLLNSMQNIIHGSDLADCLHKTLKKRRYLIVMDDVWDIDAWDQVKRFFPDDNNGSRVILTTRLQDVAIHVGCPDSIYHPSFLSITDSWKLLCKKAFGKEHCPPELEGVGKEIANNCKGLPLSLAVIGGVLNKSVRTLDYWRHVAQNVNSALNDTDDQVMNILSLSYKHLPHQLRACFLYMGVLPENRAISKSKLIRLWVAEGFIKPVPSKSLEEMAHEYLENLVDRNMILVRERNYAGGIKKCGTHDLMRDLCLRISQQEKFLKIINSQLEMYIDDYLYNFRHVYMQLDSHKFIGVSGFLTNPLLHIITESPNTDLLSRLLNSHQLRVFEAKESPLSLPDATMDLVGLRYISFCCMGESYAVPSSISKLSYLQTFVITSRTKVMLPLEIWRMPRLRHIKTRQCFLPYPRDAENWRNIVPLENLQTLKGVTNFIFSEDSIRMMPNLKKLRIRFELDFGADLSSYCIDNLVLLHQLEALNVSIEDKTGASFGSVLDADSSNFISVSDLQQLMTSKNFFKGDPDYTLPENFSVPPTLNKLTLTGFRLRYMASIGSLQYLETLNLNGITFDGSVWELAEGEFLQLKSLSISYSDVEYFIADETSFPMIQSLCFSHCTKLKEIPSRIGDIQTLGLIKMSGCAESAQDSVELIRKEQQELGNDRLRVLGLESISEDEFIEGFARWLDEHRQGQESSQLHVGLMFIGRGRSLPGGRMKLKNKRTGSWITSLDGVRRNGHNFCIRCPFGPTMIQS